MALMKCPECGRMISDQAASCPQCGYIPGKQDSEVKTSQRATNDKGHLLPVIIVLLVLSAVIVFVVGETSIGMAPNDQKAYEYISKAAYQFKDPSSVRLEGGHFSDSVLECRISATNSYGARNSRRYKVYSYGSVEETVGDSFYDSTRFLDLKKINRKLEKELTHN